MLRIESIVNFRDVAGHETADGRCVRWGTVYRSGHLGTLSREDAATLEALSIRAEMRMSSTTSRAIRSRPRT